MRGPHRAFRLAAPAALAAVAVAGCGSDGHYANEPRPPTPIVVTAAVLPGKISVSPTKFGAGPISLIVTNQTDTSQRVAVVRQINGQPQQLEQTAPIDPHDTASLKTDVDRGRYLIRVGGDGIAPARVSVGAPRPSAQNKLLQP
jgi:hypothetical protein